MHQREVEESLLRFAPQHFPQGFFQAEQKHEASWGVEQAIDKFHLQFALASLPFLLLPLSALGTDFSFHLLLIFFPEKKVDRFLSTIDLPATAFDQEPF